MALSTAIYNIISANSNCASTFGNRIFPITVPENERIPAVVYRIDSIEPTFSQGHTQQWDEVSISLTILGDTYTLCETYAGYVRTAITQYRGTTGSVTVKETTFNGMSDGDIYQKGQGETASTGVGIFTKNIQMTMMTSA